MNKEVLLLAKDVDHVSVIRPAELMEDPLEILAEIGPETTPKVTGARGIPGEEEEIYGTRRLRIGERLGGQSTPRGSFPSQPKQVTRKSSSLIQSPLRGALEGD